jgi:hypothetical protein
MTKKNPRVHRDTLPAELAEALLNIPFGWTIDGVPQPAMSLGRKLREAQKALEEAVTAANEVLALNPLMEIIAEHAARQIGRRGHPIVVVDPNGEVMLEVHYLANGDPAPIPLKARKSSLPRIVEIRRDAQLHGIDPEPFGKNKKRLIEAINLAKAAQAAGKPAPKPEPPEPPKVEPPKKPEPKPESAKKPEPPKPKVEPPKPKMTRTAPSVTPPQTVRLDGRRVIPLDDDDDDLTTLFSGKKPAVRNPVNAPISGAAVEVHPEDPPPPLKPKPKPTPRRGTPAPKKPAPKRAGRSLSAIAKNAEREIDIEAILAAPAPTIIKDPDDD